ncbi:MAG: hypothetical protein AAGB26_13345 [Planctomycetota bacterium]
MQGPIHDKPWKLGRVLVTPDYFIYQQKRYRYGQVRHFQLYANKQTGNVIVAQTTTSKMNCLEFELLMHDGTSIGDHIISKRTTAELVRFRKGCEYLRQQTLDARLAGYLNQLERYGCFVYGGLAFYRDGSVKTRRKRRVCRIQETKIEYRVGVMVLKGAGLVPLTDRVVKLEWDSDILYALLDQLYGVRWVTTRWAGDRFLLWKPGKKKG